MHCQLLIPHAARNALAGLAKVTPVDIWPSATAVAQSSVIDHAIGSVSPPKKQHLANKVLHPAIIDVLVGKPSLLSIQITCLVASWFGLQHVAPLPNSQPQQSWLPPKRYTHPKQLGFSESDHLIERNMLIDLLFGSASGVGIPSSRLWIQPMVIYPKGEEVFFLNNCYQPLLNNH